MMNPVLRREAITTMRSWKTYATLVLFVGIAALGAALYIRTSVYYNYRLSFDPADMIWLYVLLAAVQMALIVLTTPAIAAGSISGERERQTLDLLLVTKMSPLSIVLGKLMSSLAYILLLVVAMLPVFAIIFYFGSISILQLVQLFFFVLCSSCMIGSVSVFLSCRFKKTITAIVFTYLIIGLLCFGTLIALMFGIFSYQNTNGQEIPLLLSILILIPNPGVAFFSLIDIQLGSNIVSSLLSHSQTNSSILLWMAEHLWILHLIFDAVMVVIFVTLTAFDINPIHEKRRKVKK